MVVFVRLTHHGDATLAPDPDKRPIDAGVQFAAQAVVQVENIQLSQQAHRRQPTVGCPRPRSGKASAQSSAAPARGAPRSGVPPTQSRSDLLMPDIAA